MKIPFEPNFKKGGGLITAVVQDIHSNEVIMLAYMNEEAYQKTLETGEAHYYSRSKQRLWHKGETSGNVQKVKSVRLDCDADTVLLLVEQVGGAACHEGYTSCFYREVQDTDVRICCERKFDPKEVYKK